jgi:RHS repeat-associated protein
LGATRVITYAYDGVQRLTDAVECPGSTYHYGYDLASNRTLETIDGVVQQQVSYDAANQVITATTPQGTTSYAYDAAGNLLSDGANAYSYDALDRLTALAGAGATEGYGYNGDGALVTQTVNGVPTAYTQDLAVGQSQVLQTATGTGTPTVTDYLYGDGAERLASLPSGGGARTWYMPDPQGSVRYTTDDGANASLTVNYDPYGTPEGGATPPTFGYDGELQDAATGLQNLRARTYNPATGQFLTRDPLEQQTGQAYLYAGGDPVNGSDPSGDCTIVGIEVSLGLPGSSCSGQITRHVVSSILHPGITPAPDAYHEIECIRAQLSRLHLRGVSPAQLRNFVITPIVALRAGLTVGGRAVAGVAVLGEAAGAVDLAAVAAGAFVVVGAVVVAGGAVYYIINPVKPSAPPVGLPQPEPAPTPNPSPSPTPGPTVGPVPVPPPGATATPGHLPVLEVRSSLIPLIERHTEIAFGNNYPDVLTFDQDREGATTRGDAVCGPIARRRSIGLPGSDVASRSANECDEYPYRSTFQGGSGTGRLASIAAIPAVEQRRQQNLLRNFYRQNSLHTGDQFLVEAINDANYRGPDPQHNP